MIRVARYGLAILGLIAPVASLSAQTAPPASRAPVQDPSNPARPSSIDPRLAEKVGSVNAVPITKGDLVKVLGEFQVPPGNEERAYQAAMDLFINTKLLENFLDAKQIEVPPGEVQEVIDKESKSLEQNGGSVESFLADTNTTMDELRRRVSRSLQWKRYVEQIANQELPGYIQRNLDLFRGTQVKASHILLKVPDGASDADKAVVRARLEAIRKEIESQAIAFADAANKYSEDDGNLAAKNGGDLGYFPRKGQMIEAISDAAFALKDQVGRVSTPVESEYGLHLIQVTGVKPGQPIEPAQFLEDPEMKQAVLNQFATEKQAEIVEAERAKAQIEIPPMPTDLFRLMPTTSDTVRSR